MDRRGFIKLACLTPLAPLVSICNKYPDFDPKKEIGQCIWYADTKDRDEYMQSAKDQASMFVPPEYLIMVEYIEQLARPDGSPLERWNCAGWVYSPAKVVFNFTPKGMQKSSIMMRRGTA